MAKRVGIVLTGCGGRDGTEVREALLALLAVERGRATTVFAAPDVPQPFVVDHVSGERSDPSPARQALSEAARLARGRIVPLAALALEDVDALIVPGGQGVAATLSNYVQKHEVCDVDPHLARLLKGCLASHRPMGFISLGALLAARVLGPVSGVRVTLGPRGTSYAKHASIMGADVRPCEPDDVVVDQKARVLSTPAYLFEEDPPLFRVAAGIDRLVKGVLGLAQDRAAAPVNAGSAQPSRPAAPPRSPAPPAKPEAQRSVVDPLRRPGGPSRRPQGPR